MLPVTTFSYFYVIICNDEWLLQIVVCWETVRTGVSMGSGMITYVAKYIVINYYRVS